MPSHHLGPSTSPSSLPPRVLRSLWWSRNSQCSHLWPRPCTPAHTTGCTRVLTGGIRTKSSQACSMRWSRGPASDFTGKEQQIQMLLLLWHEPKADFTVGYFITDFIDLDQMWCHIRKLCKNCVSINQLIHSIWSCLSCDSLRSFSIKTRKAPVKVHLYRRTDIFMKSKFYFCNYHSLAAGGRSSQRSNFRERSRVKMCAGSKMDHSMILSGKRKSKSESWVKSVGLIYLVEV